MQMAGGLGARALCVSSSRFGRRIGRIRIVSLAACLRSTDVVGELISGEIVRVTFANFRQHGCVPFVPLRHYPAVYFLAAYFQVGALHWVLSHIEEKRVVEDLQILVVPVSGCSLCIRLISPKQLALD